MISIKDLQKLNFICMETPCYSEKLYTLIWEEKNRKHYLIKHENDDYEWYSENVAGAYTEIYFNFNKLSELKKTIKYMKKASKFIL